MPPVFIPVGSEPIDFDAYSPCTPDDDGLVFVGANFNPQTLIHAYTSGIFPWFIQDGYPFWYCPDPRMVVFPSQIKITKSMRNVFNQRRFTYTSDTDFVTVMERCAATPRKGEHLTWIDDDFITAYTSLHKLGFAHSFECRLDGQLVGGLYGVAIGKVFFGESMFSTVTNASKAAFIQAVRFLDIQRFDMIDCQVYTDHLKSLGGVTIGRKEFLNRLSQSIMLPSLNGIKWTNIFNPDIL